MSYDIVYSRQFLKAGDKIIPLVLIGSNNLWEHTYHTKNSQRRVRNWNPLMNSCNSIPLRTAEEIMEKAQSWTGGKYQEHFKWHSKWVDDKALITFVKNGIRDAASLEELKEASSCPSEVYVRCNLDIWYNDADGRQHNTIDLLREIHTTEDLLGYMDEASEQLAARMPSEDRVYVSIEFPYDKAVQYPKVLRHRERPERLNADFWVIHAKRKSGGDYFISKLTSRSLYFAYTSDCAKQFKSRTAAEKWAAERQLRSRFENIEDLEYQYVA